MKAYTDLLDEQINKEKTNEAAYYPLRPSASGYCSRKLAHDLAAYLGLGEKKSEDKKPSVVRLLDLGHSIEWHALKWLKKIPGYEIKYSQQSVEMFRLPSGRIVEGSTDAVMWSPETKGVLDVKSVGDRWSNHFSSKWAGLIDAVDKNEFTTQFGTNAWYVENIVAFVETSDDTSLIKNIMQVNLYACSKFLQDRGIDHGSIYRYNKNNSDHFELRFKPSMELFDRVKRRFELIENAVMKLNDPTVAPKEFALGSFECAYCPYSSDCYPQNDVKASMRKEQGFSKKKWATNLADLEGKSDIGQLFDELSVMQKASKNLQKIEEKIILELQDHSVDKIKLPNNDVYEVVYLKSPKPHYELRRSKL